MRGKNDEGYSRLMGRAQSQALNNKFHRKDNETDQQMFQRLQRQQKAIASSSAWNTNGAKHAKYVRRQERVTTALTRMANRLGVSVTA